MLRLSLDHPNVLVGNQLMVDDVHVSLRNWNPAGDAVGKIGN